MSDIIRHDGLNTGGVNPLSYVFSDEVATIEVDSDLSANITLKVGKEWKYLYGTDGSIGLESKEEDTPSGMKYTYQFDLSIPKDRADVELYLKNMNNRGIILLARNKNGTVRLFGDIDNPMRKKGKLSWPADTGGFNGTRLTLFGEYGHPAYYLHELDGEVPVEPPGGGGDPGVG